MQEFNDVLALERAIIYFLVNWSGPERTSRIAVGLALKDLENDGTPVFQIDCSDQEKEYVVKWLIDQRKENLNFYYGGYGETVLITKGTIIDFIKFPGRLGVEKVKEKIAGWKNNYTS